MVMLSPGSGGLSSPKQRCPVPGHILHWCWQQQGILHRDPHPLLGHWGKPPPVPWPGETPAPLVPASPAHLEADVPLLAAQAGQHEEDEGEEPREGNGHDSQRGGPGELAKGGAVCGDRRGMGSGRGAQRGHVAVSRGAARGGSWDAGTHQGLAQGAAGAGGVTALLCPLCWLICWPGWVGSPGGTPELRQDPASSWHGWGQAQSPW